MVTYPSKYLERTVDEFSRLPGIGRKTALRLALYILKQDREDAETLAESILNLRREVLFCKKCHNISDSELCEVCSGTKRDTTTLCVVEDIRDFLAIENTSQYKGLYHILGGIISPMEGIGPNDLNIESLVKRLTDDNIHEIILALPTTIEGDTTNYYIFKKIKHLEVMVTTIARGISIGDELEYSDEITLGRSIINRLPYQDTLSK